MNKILFQFSGFLCAYGILNNKQTIFSGINDYKVLRGSL